MKYFLLNIETELRKVVQGKKTKVGQWVLLRLAAERLLAPPKTGCSTIPR